MQTRLFPTFAEVTLLFLMLLPTAMQAGVDTAWVRSYDGTGGGDAVNSMVLDSVGNVYVTGWSRGSGTGWDCVTLKYDSMGTQLWALDYNSPSPETGYDQGIALTLNGVNGVYVVGTSEGPGSSYDFLTMKISATGETLWTRRYNGPGNGQDWALAAAADESGGVCVTGYGWAGAGARSDWITILYDSAGDTQWVREENGTADSGETSTCIVLDESGAAYAAGYCINEGTSGDATIVKYGRDGTREWARSVNGFANGSDRFLAATRDDSGYLYLAGYVTGDGTGLDLLTCKCTSRGDTLWTRTYNGHGDEKGYAISVDEGGNVYVTGSSVPPDSLTMSCLTVKYSPTGTKQWNRWYDGPGRSWNEAYSIAVDGAGSAYIAGFTWASGGLEDWLAVKYSTDGAQQWACTYDGAGHGGDRATGLQIGPDGCIYVSGWAVQAGGSMDYTAIKYRQTPGAVEEARKVQPMTLDVGPNPARRTARVTFGRIASSPSRVALYDATGTLVLERVVSAAARQLTIDVSGFSAGVYLVRMQSDGLNATQKLIVQH